jgi:hypothetical protein
MGSTIGQITQGGITKGLDGTATGITAEQRTLLQESGLKEGSKEWKQMEMQMKMSNLAEAVNLISTITKKLNSMTEAMIQNIR